MDKQRKSRSGVREYYNEVNYDDENDEEDKDDDEYYILLRHIYPLNFKKL